MQDLDDIAISINGYPAGERANRFTEEALKDGRYAIHSRARIWAGFYQCDTIHYRGIIKKQNEGKWLLYSYEDVAFIGTSKKECIDFYIRLMLSDEEKNKRTFQREVERYIEYIDRNISTDKFQTQRTIIFSR